MLTTYMILVSAENCTVLSIYKIFLLYSYLFDNFFFLLLEFAFEIHPVIIFEELKLLQRVS